MNNEKEELLKKIENETYKLHGAVFPLLALPVIPERFKKKIYEKIKERSAKLVGYLSEFLVRESLSP